MLQKCFQKNVIIAQRPMGQCIAKSEPIFKHLLETHIPIFVQLFSFGFTPKNRLHTELLANQTSFNN